MRRPSSLAFFGFASASLLALNCGTADSVDSSESNHTAGEYIQENAVYAWAEPDYEAFEALKNEGSWSRRSRLADDHPAVVRLQQWIDRFDAVVRAEVKEHGQTLVAPVPKAIVYQDSTINAWVSFFPACLGAIGSESAVAAAATNDDDDADAGPRTENGSIRVDKDKLEYFSQYSTCLTPKNWPALDGAFAEWWNQKKPTCQLSPQNGKNLAFSVVGEGCDTERAKTPSPGVMWSTGSGIHATTAIMSKLSETAFAVVVSHELGHYYRAHGSSAYREKYDFWFQRDVHEPKRPLPAEDAAKLKAQIDALLSSRTFTPVPNQKFSPRTSAWLASNAFTSTFGTFTTVCEEARTLLLQGSFASVMSYGGMLRKDEQAKYLAFEEAILSCGADVELTDASRAAFLDGVKTTFSAEKPEVFATHSTLKAFIESVDAVARRYDEEESALREHLNKNHIGWYTSEQEADDLAMDLSTKVGISPDEVVAAWLENFSIFEGESSMEEDDESIGPKECRTLYENDFVKTNEDGSKTDVYVPLGGMYDEHHTGCYRLFNFWREKNAHRYVTAAAPAPFTPSWDEIQALLSSEPLDVGSTDAGQ